MIFEISISNINQIFEVINRAAVVYKGVIPKDRWKEPYMSLKEIKEEIDSDVRFFGWFKESKLVGVMGIQHVKNVTLIRHAYVAPEYQKKGIGTKLLEYLLDLIKNSNVLVGTWQAAGWAIKFYKKHRFELVSKSEKNNLLRKYWKIPDRQIETSVVLKLKKNNSENED